MCNVCKPHWDIRTSILRTIVHVPTYMPVCSRFLYYPSRANTLTACVVTGGEEEPPQTQTLPVLPLLISFLDWREAITSSWDCPRPPLRPWRAAPRTWRPVEWRLLASCMRLCWRSTQRCSLTCPGWSTSLRRAPTIRIPSRQGETVPTTMRIAYLQTTKLPIVLFNETCRL